MSRCVILGAGPVTDPGALRALLCAEDVFIAADGGMRLAERLGVCPVAIVADFDSSAASNASQHATVVRLPVKKDMTDTSAAADYALEHGYRDFLLLGCTGGRLDHQYAALQLLAQLVERGCDAMMADETNRITVARQSPVTVPSIAGWSLSLFAFGGTVNNLSIRGAEYNLENYILQPDDPLCISNAVERGTAEITFDSGMLLIYRSKT